VLGRPVHFHDGDAAADARAEAALAELAQELGFAHVSFQLEPIAAALEYEQRLTAESLVLIVDIGGGTSDFSVLRLSPARAKIADRRGDVLATGGLRLGGGDFDRALSLDQVMPGLGYRAGLQGGTGTMPNHYYLDLATWHRINALYVPRVARDIKALRQQADRPELLDRLARVLAQRAGHALALRVEAAKIALSQDEAARLNLSDLTGGPNPMATRAGLTAQLAPAMARLSGEIAAVIARAGLQSAAIETVFLTGGGAQMPMLRAMAAQACPNAQIATGDMLGSVGAGLARTAAARFG